jgi:hypothetical protein
MAEPEKKLEQLQRVDEARLPGRAERAARTKVHGVIPNHFYSAASSECRETFIDGHFYACISLAQAVAEGLTRFVSGFHPVGAKNDPKQQVHRLNRDGVISNAARDAFLRIWGNDRNTFHHVNRDIPTDPADLERRGEECVMALFEIESELFAFEIADGRMVPKNEVYWPKLDEEHLEVFLRLAGN